MFDIFTLLLKDPHAVNLLLEVLSFVSAIIFFTISIIKSDELQQVSLKIGGACFVMLLALSANTPAVYGLAIFIVATFITKLDFLENLAAIFWNRKEFWKYRASLSKATSKEAEKKLDNEIKREPLLSLKFGTPDAIKSEVVKFEHDVITALQKSQLFPNASIKPQQLLNVGNQKYVLDAVIQTTDIDYIIEVKMTLSTQTMKTIAHQMEKYVQALIGYYATHGQLKEVRSIIVIPDSEAIDDVLNNSAVLKFNMDSKSFINLEAMKKWISNEDI